MEKQERQSGFGQSSKNLATSISNPRFLTSSSSLSLIIFRERGHLFRVTLQCTGVFLYCWFPKIIILIMIIWSTSGARLHSGQCNHVTLQPGDIKTKFCLRQPFSFNGLSASMVTTVVHPTAATTQAETDSRCPFLTLRGWSSRHSPACWKMLLNKQRVQLRWQEKG